MRNIKKEAHLSVLIIKLLSLQLIIIMLGFAIFQFAMHFNSQYEQYLSEGHCATRYVKQGFHRADVITEDGHCYLKLNAKRG